MSELRITFLGTSSGRPTPRRGCASIALQLGPDVLLFDCGEGTQLQLLKAGVKTSKLKAICLTHFHGDHVNGLPGLLGTMGLGGHRDPVTIASPPGLPKYFQTLRRLSILHTSFPVRTIENGEGLVFETPSYTIRAFPLVHRVPTWGFRFDEVDLPGRFDLEAARALGVPPGPLYGRLQRGEAVTLEDGRTITPDQVLGTTRKGRSIAYVSDSRPSDKVARFVEGVDVLIHESTYLHEFADQAEDRGHSTTIEAATIAKKAGVKRLVLTHISPKHTQRKPILAEARGVFAETSLAEDFDTFEVPIPA